MVSKLKCQALGYFTTLVTSSIDSETQDALRAIRIQERLATHGMTAVICVHVMSCFDALKNRELLVRFFDLGQETLQLQEWCVPMRRCDL